MKLKNFLPLILVLFSLGCAQAQSTTQVEIKVNVLPNTDQFFSQFPPETPQGSVTIFEDGKPIKTLPLNSNGSVVYDIDVTSTTHKFYASFLPVYTGGNYTFQPSMSKIVTWFPSEDIPRNILRRQEVDLTI